MAKAGLIDNIRDNLFERRNTRNLDVVDKADRELIQDFKKIEVEKDVSLTLDAVGAIFQDPQRHHINDKEISKSNATALIEWEGAKNTYALLQERATKRSGADVSNKPDGTCEE